MSEPSTESRGEDLSISSAEASPAKILETQVRQKPDSPESGLDSGLKCLEWFAKWDRDSSSWKTQQFSLFGGLEEFSAIWPRWGIMRDGECFPLETLAHDTSVRGCLSLPTVTASWGKRGPGLSNNLDNLRMSERSTKKTLAIVSVFGWRWPATLHEWMMGWPIKWSALTPLETDKFRQWFDSHGRF